MPGNAITYAGLLAWLGKEMPSRFEARQLFTCVTGFAAHDLPICGNALVKPEQADRCRALCTRRLAGEPLQYLLGEWEFYGLPLYVGEGVLIPRADTELLVDISLEILRGIPEPEILDLCSGSGCIPIALASRLPQATVTAVELSEAAFGYLVRNIRRNGVAVEVVRGDIGSYTHPRPANLITANPPYIPRGDLAGLQPEVGHEPVTALCGGEDGLDFYRVIAGRYARQLLPGGHLCLEVGAGQSEAVGEILAQNGFSSLRSHRDLAGIDRVVTASIGNIATVETIV